MLSNQVVDLYGQVAFELGSLEVMVNYLPNTRYFVKEYDAKKAVLISAIKKIYAILADIIVQRSNLKKESHLFAHYTKELDVFIETLCQKKDFKKHHLDYYRALDRVRTEGDFEQWIIFYLNAIKETSIDAYRRAED